MSKSRGFFYEITYTKAAEKFFCTHEKIREQYIQSIREILVGDNPSRVDVKRLKATHSEYYRMRIGKYRVIYTIIKGKIVVINTIYAGSRGDVYKNSKGLL